MRRLIMSLVAGLLGVASVWAAAAGVTSGVSVPEAGGTATTSVSFTTGGQYLFAGGSRPDWITGISLSVKSGSNTFNLGSGNNNITVVAGATASIAFTATANTTGSTRAWTYSITSSSATISVLVSQMPNSVVASYTITYKPGSLGTGTQQTDTKYTGISLTLKNAIFTRAGYTQTGWTTYEGGSKMYNLGATYTANAALTLYPVWTASTSGLANLAFYKFSGMPDSAFMTTSKTGTVVKTTFKQGEDMFIRFGYINNGTAATSAAETYSLYYDGTLVSTEQGEGVIVVNNGKIRSRQPTSSNMSIGTHTFRVVLNPDKSITESNYADNETSVSFTVTAGDTSSETKSVPVSAPAAGDSSTASLSFATAGTYQFSGGSKPSWITDIAVSIKSGSNTFNLGSGNNNVSIVAGGTATVTFSTSVNSTGAERSWTYVVTGPSTTYNVVVTQPAYQSATTYTITYKPGANGSGTQQTATKNKGVDLKLKGAIFSRTDYAQKGWATTDGGAKAYDLNGTYSKDAAVTLYPYWESTGGTGGGGTAPDWVPVAKPDTIIVYARIYDKKSSTYLENTDGILAAFSASGECRGKTALTQGPKSQLFQLTVGIDSSSETGLTLKYWSASTDVIEIGETFNASAATIGSIASPKVFYVGSIVSTFTLAQGWTWVSVNVDPADASFATVFKGVSFANDDVVKSSDGSATYFDGTWYPSPETFKLVAGRAYAVKKSTAGSAIVEVEGSAAATAQTVTAGWNWIGVTSSDSASLAKLTHSAGFSNDDVINSSSGSATYYDGTWYGDLETLEVGVGYKAKFAKVGTINFNK